MKLEDITKLVGSSDFNKLTNETINKYLIFAKLQTARSYAYITKTFGASSATIGLEKVLTNPKSSYHQDKIAENGKLVFPTEKEIKEELTLNQKRFLLAAYTKFLTKPTSKKKGVIRATQKIFTKMTEKEILESADNLAEFWRKIDKIRELRPDIEYIIGSDYMFHMVHVWVKRNPTMTLEEIANRLNDIINEEISRREREAEELYGRDWT